MWNFTQDLASSMKCQKNKQKVEIQHPYHTTQFQCLQNVGFLNFEKASFV